MSIYSLYIHLPSTEKINLLSTNYKPGQRKHFRKFKFHRLIGTKHFPESKIIPRIQNTFGFWEVFWRSVFGFWEVFWRSVFEFWHVFCRYEPPYKGTLSVTSAYAIRTSVINSQIVLILRVICHDQRIYEQIIFCKTGLSIKVADCIFLHK